MRVRLLVFCVVLLSAALGVAGCSSATGASGGNPHAGPPTGTVTVRSGGKVVCVIILNKSGTGTCKVNTANYRPGKVTFTGTYNGSGNFKPGNGTTTLTLRPAQQTS